MKGYSKIQSPDLHYPGEKGRLRERVVSASVGGYNVVMCGCKRNNYHSMSDHAKLCGYKWLKKLMTLNSQIRLK